MSGQKKIEAATHYMELQDSLEREARADARRWHQPYYAEKKKRPAKNHFYYSTPEEEEEYRNRKDWEEEHLDRY